jgi:hypothetical protein
MKRLILAGAIALTSTVAMGQYLGTGSNPNSHPVQGHTTSSGTYVPPTSRPTQTALKPTITARAAT